MTQYAICRHGRFLKYTKSNNRLHCWYLFFAKHEELGGVITDDDNFIDEIAELGFKAKEYKEEVR